MSLQSAEPDACLSLLKTGQLYISNSIGRLVKFAAAGDHLGYATITTTQGP